MLAPARRTPKHLGFLRIRLKSIRLHPAGCLVDASGKTRRKRDYVSWPARAVYACRLRISEPTSCDFGSNGGSLLLTWNNGPCWLRTMKLRRPAIFIWGSAKQGDQHGSSELRCCPVIGSEIAGRPIDRPRKFKIWDNNNADDRGWDNSCPRAALYFIHRHTRDKDGPIANLTLRDSVAQPGLMAALLDVLWVEAHVQQLIYRVSFFLYGPWQRRTNYETWAIQWESVRSAETRVQFSLFVDFVDIVFLPD